MHHAEILLAKVDVIYYGPIDVLIALILLLAIGFVGFLIFDLIRRWRRARRHHGHESETWREILLKPIQGIQTLRHDLKQLLRERARRERRRKRRPPAMPR